jgi:hypothetical protein
MSSDARIVIPAEECLAQHEAGDQLAPCLVGDADNGVITVTSP